MKRVLIAIRFLTILPLDANHTTQEELGKSTSFFPLIGILIGSCLVMADLPLSAILPVEVLTLCAILFLCLLTGSIHLDGFADTVDGLSRGVGKEETLRIMRDPRIGVMGTIGVVLLLLGKVLALSGMPSAIRRRMYIAGPAIGRWAITLACATSCYAREVQGKGWPFVKFTTWRETGVSSLFVVGVSILLFGPSGLFLIASVGLLSFLLNAVIKRRIDGVTGDTLGAICEVSELASFLIALGLNAKAVLRSPVVPLSLNPFG
jgi:adenosylcobinamide-GDP ribazoletransferase